MKIEFEPPKIHLELGMFPVSLTKAQAVELVKALTDFLAKEWPKE